MQAVRAWSQDEEITDLITLLAQQAERYDNKPVYSQLDRQLQVKTSIGFAQLYEQASALAAALQAAGLQGKPLMMLYLPGEEFPVAFWAAILAGVCPVPVARPRGRDWAVIDRIRQRSGARMILGSAPLLKLLPSSLLAHVRTLCHEELVRQSALCSAWRCPRVKPGDRALLQFTSGSTGQPKGVVLTHGNILANLLRIGRSFACNDNDIGLSWLPLHHDMGLIGHVLQPVFSGIHNYFMAPVNFLGRPLNWLEAISKIRATISGAPCFAYALCVEAMRAEPPKRLDLGSWRIAYCGAEKISASVLREFQKQLQPAGMRDTALFPCYGLAESTLFVTGRHSTKITMKPGQASPKGIHQELVSVGPADDGIRIVNPATRSPCVESQAGEIWLSSPSVAAGYHSDTDASAVCFDQCLTGIEGRFLSTGDMGMIVDGELYLLGRQKNLIKLRGSPVFAEDIEQLVMDATRDRGVARCAAIGVDRHGTEGMAVLVELVRGIGAAQVGQLQRDIWNLVCESAGVVPHALTILQPGSLPLTTSGKVQRFACQRLIS